MHLSQHPRGRYRPATVGVLALALLLAGCDQADSPAPSGVDAVKPQATADAMSKSIEDPLHLPFAKAIRPEPPANALPPDKTLTGKSVGKLYVEVEKLWPTIRFVDDQGRKLQYRAVLETDRGAIEIELLADVAPNHVRSFVALAKAGYYDGLLFESRVGEPKGPPPQLIEAGSPTGDGNELASIGYWLRTEIPLKDERPTIHHETGVVGSGRGYETDADGCRFYISLSAAPALDGEYTIFGRVTRGLDVVQRIFELPVRDSRDDPAFLQPPVIRRVTISVQPLEKSP